MNLGFEEVLLGACLRSDQNIPLILDGVKEEDFLSFKHRAIFKGIRSLYDKKAPIDPLSLSNELNTQGKKSHPQNLSNWRIHILTELILITIKVKSKSSPKKETFRIFYLSQLKISKTRQLNIQTLKGKSFKESWGFLTKEEIRPYTDRKPFSNLPLKIITREKLKEKMGKNILVFQPDLIPSMEYWEVFRRGP